MSELLVIVAALVVVALAVTTGIWPVFLVVVPVFLWMVHRGSRNR